MTDWNRFREIQDLRESGRPAEALAQFQSLREAATDAADISSILLGVSLCYSDLRRYDEAASAASEAIRLLPEDSPSRPYAEFSLAVIHEKQSKLEVSAQELRTLLKVHAELLSTGDHIEFRRGIQLRLIADLIVLGHALEPLSIADGLKREDISPEERAELSYREANAQALLGRNDQAVKLFREAVSGPLERSLAARSHFHIGEILYDRSEFSEALDEFKQAEELADGRGPDRKLFADWVNHSKLALSTNSEGAPP